MFSLGYLDCLASRLLSSHEGLLKVYLPKASRCRGIAQAHKCDPWIDSAQSVDELDGDNPWIDCAKLGSEVRAIQSTDGPNPNFAPNIYITCSILHQPKM